MPEKRISFVGPNQGQISIWGEIPAGPSQAVQLAQLISFLNCSECSRNAPYGPRNFHPCMGVGWVGLTDAILYQSPGDAADAVYASISSRCLLTGKTLDVPANLVRSK